MAAARGIAAIVADDELREDYIVPSVFNRDVADRRRRRGRRRGQAPGRGRGRRGRDRLRAAGHGGVPRRPAVIAGRVRPYPGDAMKTSPSRRHRPDRHAARRAR